MCRTLIHVSKNSLEIIIMCRIQMYLRRYTMHGRTDIGQPIHGKLVCVFLYTTSSTTIIVDISI